MQTDRGVRDYRVAATSSYNGEEESSNRLRENEITKLTNYLNSYGQVENTADGSKSSTIFTVAFARQETAKEVCREIQSKFDYHVAYQLTSKRSVSALEKEFVFYIIVSRSSGGILSSALGKTVSGLLALKKDKGKEPAEEDEDDDGQPKQSPHCGTPINTSSLSSMSTVSKIINLVASFVKIAVGSALLYFLIMVMYFLYVNDHNCTHANINNTK